MSEVTYVTKEDLQAIISRVLHDYPWFEDYPVRCHAKCSRWEIDAEHGPEAGQAWEEYDAALWLLTGERAGVPIAT